LSGSIASLPPIKAGSFWLYHTQTLTGALRFNTGAVTSDVRIVGSISFTPADYSQTIVNWDACNAGTFARTWNSNQVKRSQLTAAGEAAVVSLLAKGCVFTFLAE
jgi:hypothetical protein